MLRRAPPSKPGGKQSQPKPNEVHTGRCGAGAGQSGPSGEGKSFQQTSTGVHFVCPSIRYKHDHPNADAELAQGKSALHRAACAVATARVFVKGRSNSA